MEQQKHFNAYTIQYPLVTLLAVFAVIFTFSLLTISMTATAKEKDVVRIAMSSTPLSSPLIIAHEKGFFKETGLNVDIQQVKGGHLAFELLVTGEADIATSSEAVVMFNSFKRNDFSVFCTFVTSDNDVKIVARKDAGINTVNDLEGKKIGTILGTSAHFFLSHTLLINGINESKIQIINILPQETSKLLEQKKVDAVVTWEPYAYLAKKRMLDEIKYIPHERVYVETFNAISLRKYANENPDKLTRFTQALMKATEYIKHNNSASQKIVATVLGKDLDVIEETWADYSFTVELNQWLLTSMETEARWAINNNFLEVKQIPNYIYFINSKPLNEVDPKRITIFK